MHIAVHSPFVSAHRRILLIRRVRANTDLIAAGLMCDTAQTVSGVRTNLVLLDWLEGEQYLQKQPFDQKQLWAY